MEAVNAEILLAEVASAASDAGSIAVKRVLDSYTDEQGLRWSYRQARTWWADCLNPDRAHRLPYEITPHLVREFKHARFLNPLLALDSLVRRELEIQAEVERRMAQPRIHSVRTTARRERESA